VPGAPSQNQPKAGDLLNPFDRALACSGMKRNVGSLDRIMRAVAALAMLACAVMAPLPLVVRACAFGVVGGYLLLSALVGSCAGYSLIGRSTCPASGKQ
jgi:hypothetical protein